MPVHQGSDRQGGIDMDQIETFKGLQVPEIPEPSTQSEFCLKATCLPSGCHSCLFDHRRKETLEPFNEWMETRKK
jgi:hypothetical protein